MSSSVVRIEWDDEMGDEWLNAASVEVCLTTHIHVSDKFIKSVEDVSKEAKLDK